MPGTIPPGEAEGKGPSAYKCEQATTAEYLRGVARGARFLMIHAARRRQQNRNEGVCAVWRWDGVRFAIELGSVGLEYGLE